MIRAIQEGADSSPRSYQEVFNILEVNAGRPFSGVLSAISRDKVRHTSLYTESKVQSIIFHSERTAVSVRPAVVNIALARESTRGFRTEGVCHLEGAYPADHDIGQGPHCQGRRADQVGVSLFSVESHIPDLVIRRKGSAYPKEGIGESKPLLEALSLVLSEDAPVRSNAILVAVQEGAEHAKQARPKSLIEVSMGVFDKLVDLFGAEMFMPHGSAVIVIIVPGHGKVQPVFLLERVPKRSAGIGNQARELGLGGLA
jgi:hypothetical protein